MKKLLLFAIALYASAQLINAQDLEWPLSGDLNEIKTGNADNAGLNNGKDDVTFVDDATIGKKVANFDGNAFVNLPPFFSGAEAISISLWFKNTHPKMWEHIYTFGWGQAPTGGALAPAHVFKIVSHSGNKLRFRFTFHTSAAGAHDKWYDYDVDSTKLYCDSVSWYHSVITMDKNVINMYLNGNLVDTANNWYNVAPGDLATDANPDIDNVLGRSFWNDPLYNGLMYDLRVYKKALTADEVKALYNSVITDVSKTVVSQTVTVYPKGKNINVKLSNTDRTAKVSVFDITGKVLQIKAVNNISSVEFIPGIYLVKVTGEKTDYTTKVVIK